jgi:hypothetical protein
MLRHTLSQLRSVLQGADGVVEPKKQKMQRGRAHTKHVGKIDACHGMQGIGLRQARWIRPAVSCRGLMALWNLCETILAQHAKPVKDAADLGYLVTLVTRALCIKLTRRGYEDCRCVSVSPAYTCETSPTVLRRGPAVL